MGSGHSGEGTRFIRTVSLLCVIFVEWRRMYCVCASVCELIIVCNADCADWLMLSFMQVGYDVTKSTNARSTLW